jgi:Protein of unknown function (DUF4235)
MADKRGDFTSRAVGGIAGGVAGIVTRKVMSAAWKKVTGKEPPTHPEDPEVALAEAVGWAAVMAVAMSTARLLATRVATKRLQDSVCGKPGAEDTAVATKD